MRRTCSRNKAIAVIGAAGPLVPDDAHSSQAACDAPERIYRVRFEQQPSVAGVKIVCRAPCQPRIDGTLS
jgi:hypothetical protein